MKNTKIVGYELNEIALAVARNNALANKLEDRITLHHSKYDSGMIMMEEFTGRQLLFFNSDSTETDIFTRKTVPFFSEADMLIQLNDFTDPGKKSTILSLFQDTHEFEFIHQKRMPSTVTHFLNTHADTLRVMNLIDEGKAERIEWLFLTSKKYL